MKMSTNTVLITGGSSGIGMALARELKRLGNTVIVTGRNLEKLELARAAVPGLHVIQSDANDPVAIADLSARVTREHPDLNVLINNAGIMRKINLREQNVDPARLCGEIDTNLKGPILLTAGVLPHLTSRPGAAILNVTSVLAAVPFALSPVYSATKAALHSYTQSLRIQLKHTNVRVFELAPPGVDTPLFEGEFTERDLAGLRKISPERLAHAAVRGMADDQFEIRPGFSRPLTWLSRLAPKFAADQLGRSAERMSEPTGRR